MYFPAVFFCTLLFLPSCGGEGTSPEEADSDTQTDVTEDDFGGDSDLIQPDIPDVTPDQDMHEQADTSPPDLDAISDPHFDTLPDVPDVSDDGACLVGLVGDPCSSASQCNCVPSSARECLTTIFGYLDFPGGYCSARCTTPAECGTGANCAEITSSTLYCLKLCSSASQCRMAEGYDCTTIPMSSDTRTYCLPPLDGERGG